MPAERRDPALFRRFAVPLVAICAVVVPCGGGALALLETGEPLFGILALALVIVLAVVSVGLHFHRVLGVYHCPRCGAALPRYFGKQTPVLGRLGCGHAEYRFICRTCDTIWKM